MQENYLTSIRKQFEYYKALGEKTFDQLDDASLFTRPQQECNSIAIITNHLWGNMLSRWTDFLSSDGEKTWRKRDLEFEDVTKTREELMRKWEEGWQCLFAALDEIDNSNFETTIYIRNQGHTVVEAINRQLGHYAYHIGQIVFIGKMLSGEAWKSLSIAKGKSSVYNEEKFAQDKHRAHFTDEFLHKDSE